MRGRGGEKSTEGRGIPKTTAKGQARAHQGPERHSPWCKQRARGDARRWGCSSRPVAQVTQDRRACGKNQETCPEFCEAPRLAFFVLFWRAEHGTAVVSHLEKVPRHVVPWELAKPTLFKLSSLFLKCFLFTLMSYTVNLKLEKVTENKYHCGKNTMLFKTIQAVWHVVLHLTMLHLIKK